MLSTDPPVIVEENFTASVSALWRALTEVNEMTEWFFENIPDFKAEVGFEIEFIVENEGRVFPHQWKVTEAIPEKRLTLEWKYGGYPGLSFVTFELENLTNGSKLTVTHTITEDFPDDVPEFSRENCQGGWEWFIGESLNGYMKGKG